MKTMVMTSILMVVLMVVSSQAGTYTGTNGINALYVETFDTDPGDWYSGGGGWESTGGNTGGYMKAFRNGYYPYQRPSSGYGYGDYVNDNFGKRFQVSYDVKYMSASGNQGVVFRLTGGGGSSFTVRWEKTLYPTSMAPTNWTTVSFYVDTTWTDAEATSNGWVRVDSTIISTNTSFYTCWSDDRVRATATSFFAQTGGNNGADHYTGVDNLRIETIYDPMVIHSVSAGTFTGGDAGEGLDLYGSFAYAIDAGGSGGTVRSAVFIADPGDAATFEGWGTTITEVAAEYGDTANDNALENIVTNSYRSSNSGDTNVGGDFNGLTGGQQYKLQIGFRKPVQAGYSGLCWDVVLYDDAGEASSVLVADNLQVDRSDNSGTVLSCDITLGASQTYLGFTVYIGNKHGEVAPTELDQRYPLYNFVTLETMLPPFGTLIVIK